MTLGGAQLTVLAFGLAGTGATAYLAHRTPPQRATQARLLGSSIAVVGWLLFLAPAPDGALYAPFLILIAAAYPLIAVEVGRCLPMRIFCWSSLLFYLLGCGSSWFLALSPRNIQIQEWLLMLGNTVPPLAALVLAAWQLTGGIGSHAPRRRGEVLS